MPLKTLMEFGLSEKEAKTYIALLELGVAGANDIAGKTGINRSSSYVVLETLKQRGLVTMAVDKNNLQKYVAATPDILLRLAEDKARKQMDVKEKIEKAVPELKVLHKDMRLRPKVYVFTDKEAIRQCYYDTFDEQVAKGMKKFRVYEDMSPLTRLLPPDFIKNDVESIKKSGARMYLISPDIDTSKTIIEQYKKMGSRDKFAIIPQTKFNRVKKSILSFSIHENKIEFFSPDSFAVIIENQEIADTLKNIFDLAWDEANRLNNKPKK